MNTVAEILLIVETIQTWMILLGYPIGSSTWIKLYHLAMLDWNKKLIAKAYNNFKNQNTKYIILVTTNTYKIEIDNLDIWLVIQYNLPLSFDSMIQRMNQAGRKK